WSSGPLEYGVERGRTRIAELRPPQARAHGLLLQPGQEKARLDVALRRENPELVQLLDIARLVRVLLELMLAVVFAVFVACGGAARPRSPRLRPPHARAHGLLLQPGQEKARLDVALRRENPELVQLLDIARLVRVLLELMLAVVFAVIVACVGALGAGRVVPRH